MGLSVHCALGSAVCSSAHGGVADSLPDEPGGYHGYQALFGNEFIQPVYSQIEAPVGEFGLGTLTASTRALASSSDATYASIENQLVQLGATRDALGVAMQADLLGAAFGGKPLSLQGAKKLIAAGHRLLRQVGALAG